LRHGSEPSEREAAAGASARDRPGSGTATRSRNEAALSRSRQHSIPGQPEGRAGVDSAAAWHGIRSAAAGGTAQAASPLRIEQEWDGDAKTPATKDAKRTQRIVDFI
jgi:hypothetical protein